jgi:P-type conjugative transfer protein TrbJ
MSTFKSKTILAVAALSAILAVGATSPQRAGAQLVVIPCPTIPCPTFDGANFAKNTLTEMHTLQQMRDNILMKYYQYKQLLANIQGLKNFTWQDAIGQLSQLDQDLHKDEQVCTDLQYNNAYFSSKFPSFVSRQQTGPCDSGNLQQAHNNINNARLVIANWSKAKAARAQQLGSYRMALENATGPMQALQATGHIMAQMTEEIQIQQQLQAATINEQAAYYDTEVTKNVREKAMAKQSRSLSFYFKTGCYRDPEDAKNTTCAKTVPSPPPQ